MPPKKAPPPTSAKQKQKIIEDKTFGLKNKNKSNKVKDFVSQVQKQVNNPNGPKRPAEDPKAKAQRKKEEEEARKAELALLYRPIQNQKAPPGVDPKSMVCEFFKAGSCTKGSKCKFSHDLATERKAAKIDIYTDMRDEEKKEDTMDNWDQNKLEQVVASKHNGMKPKSDIICKFFLDALERNQYGWFWECPNGATCHYRHALPPGFILKRDAKKIKENKETITLEDFIETERGKITGPLVMVNEETFAEWKRKRIEKKKQEEDEKKKTKEAAIKAGKGLSLSGRDLLTYRPELFVDDEEAMGADIYRNRGSDVEYSDDENQNGNDYADYNDSEPEEEDHVGTSASREEEGIEDEALFVEENLDDLEIEDDDDEGNQSESE